jgi:hypothetical protein
MRPGPDNEISSTTTRAEVLRKRRDESEGHRFRKNESLSVRDRRGCHNPFAVALFHPGCLTAEVAEMEIISGWRVTLWR